MTLLFTDIEGSTQRWEEQRAAMPEALRRHDALLRTAIEAHDGHVFKTMGDQFCAAFSRAPEAVAAAVDAQHAVASEDWSAVGGLAVRMALHSGATDERDGDYFGPTVNRVARLLAAAHGGQVVTSNATGQLLRGVMPERTELRDLGEHRLKDLAEPEHVWQLVAPSLPDKFPPLQSLASLPNNLPRQVTPLIGRENVLAEIERFVLEHPLVTLTGTGGVGKTRLALHAGADLLDGLEDGVWFVELAPVGDAGLVVNTIASTLGLHERSNRAMLDVLVEYLRPRRLLLILDNCEHLIDEAARAADAILRAAPNVRILATSREPLRIAAEHVYRVPSLAVPSGDLLTSEEALNYGALALFAERAAASDVNFALTDETAPIVAEVCRRLDGIALAIELAAARAKVLPPRQLAQKLDERFRVLTGGSRTALPRQQTMRALIDWSYDLLSEQEQRLFRRVAIFVGGWTLEAAESVCTGETLDALEVVDLLSSLVDKSLIVAEAPDHPRYRLLESMRAFALEKLERSGERETLERRQAEWGADLADRAFEAWWTASTWQWRAEFEPELENARAAIGWALAHDEIVLATRIVVAMSEAYRSLGAVEARSWLEAVVEKLDEAAHPVLAARAWDALSKATLGSRKIDAAQRAAELAERCDDPVTRTLSLSDMAFGLLQTGRTLEAQAVIDKALQLSIESNLTRSSIHLGVLNRRASISRRFGRFDEARRLYDEALALATALGNDYEASWMRLSMAELEFEVGSVEQAVKLACAVQDETNGPRTETHAILARANEAAYRLALDDIAGARAAAREALRRGRGAYEQAATIAIQHLATVAALSGDPRCGARLRGYVDAWFRSEGYQREPTERRIYEILTTALQERLNDAEIEALAAEGAQLSEDQAVAEALAIS